MHCEPSKCFIGGGIWHPEWAKLLLLRSSIHRRPRAWRRMLNDEEFKRAFFPSLKPNAKDVAVKKAFAAHNKEGALTKAPGVRANRCVML